jgi:hypothetical protein
MRRLVRTLTRRAVSEVCYRICEKLEEYTPRRTTGTILAAGDAIAVACMLDWKRALDEDMGALPLPLASILGHFSLEEWEEVMSFASSTEGLMGAINRPEWRHLRNPKTLKT